VENQKKIRKKSEKVVKKIFIYTYTVLDQRKVAAGSHCRTEHIPNQLVCNNCPGSSETGHQAGKSLLNAHVPVHQAVVLAADDSRPGVEGHAELDDKLAIKIVKTNLKNKKLKNVF
jgi:hypothetical protein